MTRKLLAVILSLLLALTVFAACGKESESGTETTTTAPTETNTKPEPFSYPEDADELAGSWTVTTVDGASMNFFFGGSGRGTFASLGRLMKMAYEINGNEVITVVYYEETGDVKTTVFTFEINADKLTLTTEDGLTQVFTKDPE